jgi:hypothetical protein
MKKTAKKPTRLHPYEIGRLYMVETVTKYYVGKLTWVGEQELELFDAAWVADTGRYSEGLKGNPSEVEPCPDGPVIIGRGSIVSVVPWAGIALRVVK